MSKPAVIKWLTLSLPVIKWLDDKTALVAHQNGPAICDSNWLSVLDIHTEDHADLQAMKRRAIEAYRKWSWPQLAGQFQFTEETKA